MGGALLLWGFFGWARRGAARGQDPLVHLRLFEVLPLRAGLVGLFTQNLVLMGVFFVVPLYLQLVIGLDALETGIRMLPISITMFACSAIGSRLSDRLSVRTIVRAGLATATLAIVVLVGTIEPSLDDAGFALSMALLGVGMGLIVSQLGNVVQSSVDASGRGEAGGLQYTGQQLGSSVGVALIGALVLAGLTNVFADTIAADERIEPAVAQQVGVAVGDGIDFVSSDQVAQAAVDAGIDEASAAALVDDYEQAQLQALENGLLATGVLALVSLMSTRNLPGTVGSTEREGTVAGATPAAV
jgi:hypothetical protein